MQVSQTPRSLCLDPQSITVTSSLMMRNPDERGDLYINPRNTSLDPLKSNCSRVKSQDDEY